MLVGLFGEKKKQGQTDDLDHATHPVAPACPAIGLARSVSGSGHAGICTSGTVDWSHTFRAQSCCPLDGASSVLSAFSLRSSRSVDRDPATDDQSLFHPAKSSQLVKSDVMAHY